MVDTPVHNSFDRTIGDFFLEFCPQEHLLKLQSFGQATDGYLTRKINCTWLLCWLWADGHVSVTGFVLCMSSSVLNTTKAKRLRSCFRTQTILLSDKYCLFPQSLLPLVAVCHLPGTDCKQQQIHVPQIRISCPVNHAHPSACTHLGKEPCWPVWGDLSGLA